MFKKSNITFVNDFPLGLVRGYIFKWICMGEKRSFNGRMTANRISAYQSCFVQANEVVNLNSQWIINSFDFSMFQTYLIAIKIDNKTTTVEHYELVPAYKCRFYTFHMLNIHRHLILTRNF